MRSNPIPVVSSRSFSCTQTRTLRPLLIGITAVMAVLTSAGHAGDEAAPVRADDAWIRWLPANLPAAGYVTLRNQSDQSMTLIGASSVDYASAMFHKSSVQNGVAKMLMADTIVIEPHAEVSFARAGYHIMLIDPKREVRPGDHVLVTLHFAGGQSSQVQFDVRKPDGSRSDRVGGSKVR
jgi:copper(I)-binding protein